MSIVYLDASVYRCLREEEIDLAGTPFGDEKEDFGDFEVTIDDDVLIDLSSAFRFGDLEEGTGLFQLVQKAGSKRILKHFGWLIRDEVQALMGMIPRYWWHYDEEDTEKVRKIVSELAEGKYEVLVELEIKDRMSRQEAFGRVLHHLFKETSFDYEGIDDFPSLLARYEKENRRDYIRKLMGDVVRAEKSGEIARRVDNKIFKCPTVAAFVKIPLLKQYLYKMRFEDRKRGDDEEMLHLCCLSHVDILVSQNPKFRDRFHLLYPDKEVFELEAFLEAAKH